MQTVTANWKVITHCLHDRVHIQIYFANMNLSVHLANKTSACLQTFTHSQDLFRATILCETAAC